MTDLADLIARVDGAQGPDRGLDVAIFKLVRPEYAGVEWQLYGGGLRHVMDSSDARTQPPPEATPPRYTASLDAALMLVPEGCLACVRTLWDGITHEKTAGLSTVDTYANNYWQASFQGTATTPALALCAAALRAIAAQGEG